MTYTHSDKFIGDWCAARNGVKCACGRERGSDSRMQMRVYAYMVAVAMHGAPICHCGAPVSPTMGDVDRTAAGCYRPGYVVMTCKSCNNDRTNVPEFNAERFAADVLAASLNVIIPGKADAKRIYKEMTAMGETVKRSKYYRG